MDSTVLDILNTMKTQTELSISQSQLYYKLGGKQTIQYVLDRIERFIISSNLVDLKNLNLLIKFYPVISGVAISASFSEKYEIRSVIRMTNDGNECFRWCF